MVSMHSTDQPDHPESLARAHQSGDSLKILSVLGTLADAPNEEAAIADFEQALHLLGADSGVFVSFIRDDSKRASFRCLLACDARWAAEYATHGWHEHDPWLRYAHRETEPVRNTELGVRADEEGFATRSAALGFASAVIVPAPSHAGSSRVGMLCIGSHEPGFFDGDKLSRLRVLARALAMELHRWVLLSARTELLRTARITDAELELLRHEDAGHTSKHIGALLDVKPKAVDCRFQRLLAKLEVPDRRTAARVARLYGLI